MGKTILVTGKEGFLGSEIAQHFLNQGCPVAVSVPYRNDALLQCEGTPPLLQFPWNRRSPVAAKNFLLQTLQKFNTLDEAWIVVTPERDAFGLAELAPLALDENIDASLKGPLYLVRELLQYQISHPNLTLRFVFYTEDAATLPPLAAIHYQGLKGLVSALLHQSRKRHLSVWAYDSLISGNEDYLSYLLTSPQTRVGRWNLWGEKKNLFNTLFPPKDAS